MIKSERSSWHNRGFFDGRFRGEKRLPAEGPARIAYLTGYRIGKRERLRIEAGS